MLYVGTRNIVMLGAITMDQKTKYKFIVKWSDEDKAFIATTPEFLYLSGFGDTIEDAIEQISIAVDLVVSVMKEDKFEIV